MFNHTAKRGSVKTKITPMIAVKAMDDVMSFFVALMIGAIAAMAEFPQIELPHAISSDIFVGNFKIFPIPKLNKMAIRTIAMIPKSNVVSIDDSVFVVIDAPNMIMAISSKFLEQKWMPVVHRFPIFQKLRNVVPTSMAITSGPSHV